MERTIEESLEWLISRKEHYEMDDNCQELAKALDTAINTIHKYQQIEQIVNAELEEYHPLDRNFYRLALIKEVLKDGSTN